MRKPDQLANRCVMLGKSLPEETAQLFLPLYLKHPAAVRLRSAGIHMCGITRATPGFLIHRIPEFTLAVFTLSGTGLMTIGRSRTCRLTPGTVFLAPRGLEQYYIQTGKEPWHFAWFHLLPDVPQLKLQLTEPLSGPGRDGPAIAEAMTHFAGEIVSTMKSLINDGEQPPWIFYQDSMVLQESIRRFNLPDDELSYNADRMAELYAEILLGCLDRELRALTMHYETDGETDRLEQLWEKISADIGREWSLNEMAALVNMSISTLIRQVRRRYETTPQQMLYHLRLKRAALLLATSQVPVSQLADEIGYVNLSSFSTAFRKEYGMTPREYRRSNQTSAVEPF